MFSFFLLRHFSRGSGAVLECGMHYGLLCVQSLIIRGLAAVWASIRWPLDCEEALLCENGVKMESVVGLGPPQGLR